MRGLALLAVLRLVSACSAPSTGRAPDPALTDLRLHSVAPDLVLPGTVLTITGDSFVDAAWGQTSLRLAGVRSTAAGELSTDLVVPPVYVDHTTLEVPVDSELFAALGEVGSLFDGTAQLEVRSSVNGEIYRTPPLDVHLELLDGLTPSIGDVLASGPIFPNEPLAVRGSGFLLRGEGTTHAQVSGCFQPAQGNTCAVVETVEVPIVPANPFDREHATFPFVPTIAGISPGRFRGELRLINRLQGGEIRESPPVQCEYDLQAPIVYGASTPRASFGQYVVITGGGFVGKPDGDTVLQFTGSYAPDGPASAVDVDVVLVPEFVDGRTLRYVINEDDTLGLAIDVRYASGLFQGTVTPLSRWREATVTGDPSPFSFRLAPVKQVVWINFTRAYVESLRVFGLRAVDSAIRTRTLEVIRRSFATINLEVREEEPTDFALYSRVDVEGPDLNGLGLLGYDNTPGKDTDNHRLYDRIGGVNAVTQQDDFPGFGGVFIESLLGYSAHPGPGTVPLHVSAEFDELFDPFREVAGGQPVTSTDISGHELAVGDGSACPTESGDRATQIGCAVWALGSTIGSTVSHELGHSLGLSDPYGPDFHNRGDAPNRMMDADRPFAERAELHGEGPSKFCDQEYRYLRRILPTEDFEDPDPRPPCD